MSTLPPYSTFRTDSKQMLYPQAISHGNVLTFTPPGFKQTLNIKFPDSRLPVCEKCKKNYKTRDMCRVRNSHTASPWSTAYICMTMDDTCTDENGEYIDKPLTVRMVQWQPFCIVEPFDNKTPVCSSCKKTNRTRSYCRERHKHKFLPWCTVYVLLSALETTDPSTVVAAPSKPLSKEDSTKESEQDQKPAATGTGDDADNVEDGEVWSGDNIQDIPESRTFLAKVSCKGRSIHWLDLSSDYEAPDPSVSLQAYTPIPVQPADGSSQAGVEGATQQYYAPVGSYAAHQNSLKNQQQYFFQMQQRQQQHLAAQHNGWLAPQYGQPQTQMQYPGAGPVTAGEAAAQQQKHHHDHQSPGPHHGGQWQTQPPGMMMPQLYQNTMTHFQQSGGMLPPGSSTSAGFAGMEGAHGEDIGPKLDLMDPTEVDDQEESLAKRARIV